MNNAFRRLALLASVSLPSLGYAAHAASATNPGISQFDFTDPVNDMLTICDIGTDCDFGVTVNDTSLAHTSLIDTAHGQVNQTGIGLGTGADVVLDLRNGGDADFSAIASAQGTSIASAIAVAATPISQLGQANGNVGLNFANDGSISIAASAHAEGRTAIAQGLVDGAIHQQAISVGEGDVHFGLSNSGDISVDALAAANGDGNAIATAVITSAIAMRGVAVAGNAAATATNSGSIAIDAHALAAAGGAVSSAHATTAIAVVSHGVVEHANAGFEATGSFNNEGSIAIHASAEASGPGGIAATRSGFTFADGPTAFALITAGVDQTAQSFGGGDAIANLVNDGVIDVGASAHAHSSGIGNALAVALDFNGIEQTAIAWGQDNAVATLSNAGTLAVSVSASAVADDVRGRASGIAASASGQIVNGIAQGAFANGDAHGLVENSGTIAISGLAQASAEGAYAHANMIVAGAIAQVVQGASQTATTSFGAPGIADADLENSGLIKLDFAAIAEGHRALVDAFVATGIGQAASAGGSAFGQVTNHGGIEIRALGQALAAGGTATAAGGVLIGVGQHLRGSALAQGTMINDGSITIRAGAEAISTAPSTRTDGNFALAIARIGGVTFLSAHAALTQNAMADVVDLNFDNSGVIDLGSIAHASGNGARGTASVIDGIRQLARSRDGDATANLASEGDIEMSALAMVDGNAGVATAVANASHAIEQNVFAFNGNAIAAFTNAGTFELGVAASAQGSDRVEALAAARGLTQRVGAFGSTSAGGTATDLVGQAEIHNLGSFAVAASAVAHGAHGSTFHFNPAASAFATAIAASQLANFALFENSGMVSVGANALADATANALAQAGARGLEQLAFAFAPVVQLTATNNGTIALGASALASATTGASAMAHASHGMDQLGLGVSVFESMANSGVVALAANASALAVAGRANAFANVGAGLGQNATGNAIDQAISNAGTATGLADAAASGEQTAFAVANGGGIAQQFGNGSTVGQDLENSGSIVTMAHAQATADAMAFAGANFGGSAAGSAVQQFAFGSDIAQSVANAGTVFAFAEASALANGTTAVNRSGTFLAGQASASAAAVGIGQGVFGGSASQAISNSGLIQVGAHALAQAPVEAPDGLNLQGSGSAFARAAGAEQFAFATSNYIQSIANGGDIHVLALASAEGGGGNATGSALGVHVNASGQIPLGVSVNNSGAINVAAGAVSPAHALSTARGIYVVNQGSFSSEPVAFNLAGSIENSGEINVLALVDGHSVPNSRSSAFNGGSALAEGIAVTGGDNSLTITNSGTISVNAVATESNRALAIGISATANGASTARSPGILTITNDGGSIIARQSDDDGESWHRGLAINVSGGPGRNSGAVPNQTIVNLFGDGSIYGDIALNAGDQINVANGTTYFDGVILPGAPAFGEIVLFPGIAGAGGTGLTTVAAIAGLADLNIGDHGKLILADAKFTGAAALYDGPAYAFVDNLNVAAGGTLSFELQPEASGAQDPGSFPQVFANTANLDGTLEIILTTPSGLFEDSYSWNDLIDANVRNGEFDQCQLAGALAGSLLLTATCNYDAGANVDVRVDRRAFGQVESLNDNGQSVGDGLESIYSPTLTGDITDALGDLFLLTDPASYKTALNQLSGSVYANYLQSFASLGVHYNDILDRAVDCDAPVVRGSALECRGPNPLRVWGKTDYQRSKADGDAEAGTARSRRFSGLLGVDTVIGDAGIVGGSVGYVKNKVRDFQFSDHAKAKGVQVGAYGVYDPGNLFVRATTTYSWFNGKSNRTIDFGDLAQDASFAASLKGSPDVNMWTFGLRGGARVALEGSSVLTPYVAYDYVHATLKGFTESGGEGTDLTVEGDTTKHSFLTGGVKWASQLGSVVPELEFGYRYRLGNTRSRFDATFLDGTSDDFDIVSASQGRGSFLAGLSIGGNIGSVGVKVSYSGEFSSDVTSHGGSLRLVLPLGGHSGAPSAPSDRGQ